MPHQRTSPGELQNACRARWTLDHGHNARGYLGGIATGRRSVCRARPPYGRIARGIEWFKQLGRSFTPELKNAGGRHAFEQSDTQQDLAGR